MHFVLVRRYVNDVIYPRMCQRAWYDSTSVRSIGHWDEAAQFYLFFGSLCTNDPSASFELQLGNVSSVAIWNQKGWYRLDLLVYGVLEQHWSVISVCFTDVRHTNVPSFQTGRLLALFCSMVVLYWRQGFDQFLSLVVIVGILIYML
jgi:hypothetical protein